MAGAAGGFVTRAFESMLKECSGKKHPSLQKAIQAYLDQEKAGHAIDVSSESTTAVIVKGSAVEGGPDYPHTDEKNSLTVSSTMRATEKVSGSRLGGSYKDGYALEVTEAELVLNPLQIAFSTKNLKVVELALDCLHKLLAYDHLEGDPGIDGGQNSSLFTVILDMVCNCINDSSPDSTVLQVLKVLLTAVSSRKFKVHGDPLLAVISVCYNVTLNSKSPVNQATSKAMLIQIMSTVFRRMEVDENVNVATYSPDCDVVRDVTPAPEFSQHVLSSEDDDDVLTMPLERSETLEEGTHPSPTEEDANISVPSVEELQNLAGTTDIKVLEAVLDKAVHTKLGTKNAKGMDLRSMMVEHRDALLVFRTLCKMGMKQDSDEVTTKTRILSLELLHGLLEAVDLSLTKNVYFIDSIKAYLTYVLLRASVAFSPIIFQYATAIFSVLLRFRESLKAEVGIFFPVIILRTLDGSESALSHRISVLRMLEKVCKDPQMLVDIFVNYDCDLEAPNLFEHMVTTLSRITQGTLILDTSTAAAPQMASVRGSSLQCLVNVLKSLVDWKKLQNESVVIKRSRDASLSVADRVFPDVKEDGDDPADFKKAKAHKCTLEAAISEFNRDPVKGVEYLIANGLVENSPASVASFLKCTSSLDKAMIGDYLGHHEEFPLAVMNAYVDGMEFSGLNFSRAIRLFLQMFRLPGEAQKIDRIMEKFSERYYADNPDLFKSANVAYILSYSVIMLNTDAHNPLVWPKMSKSDFFHLNSVSNTAESAPKELLEGVYDSIVSEEIKMKHDNAFLINDGKKRLDGEGLGYLMNILKLNLPRRKSQNDAQHESEAIIHKTQAILRNRAAKKEFYTSHQVELVRPIIESVGWPLLATFSVIMEEGDHKSKAPLCMEGFRAGIYITYSLGMDTMRYAFLTSLVRFTFLHAPKQMRSKNVEALRTLLSFCESEPATLQDTWNAVLECVSRLEYIISTPSISASVMDTSNQLSRDAIVHNLKELAGKPLEQVYLNSTKLTSDSVVEFFSALCGVSSEELKQNPPRVFSLQKLVEISYYNMARIRLVWAQIWSVLSNHFIFSGSHRDEKVAMYAIDSLRQLGMKYLERAELANFSFQNDILRPFIVLIRSSPSETLRSLIVDSVVQMIKSKVGNIKSGWKSVFMIFTSAADDECESIVEGAFENVEQVILEHFDQVVGDCFMDCVNCIIRFANSKCSDQISLKSIALLRICEDRLADGLIPGGALKPLRTTAAAVDLTEHYWFPMLAGLSELTSDSRVEVRRCALEVLFDLLNERGSKFSRSFWQSVFHRVLFPIFYDGAVSVSDEETVVHSLQLLCDLFSAFYREVSFMLPPLLALLLDCAKKPDQSVVSISLGALVRLIDVGGHQFAAHDWETLLNGLRDALYMTQPLELLNAAFPDHGHRPPDSPAASQPSPSRKAAAASGEPQDRDGPSIGQRFLGNVMDNAFVRSLTSSRSRLPPPPDVPSEDADALPERDVEEEDDGGMAPVLPETVLSKSIAQLLLLGAVDCVQKKFWLNLEGSQKIAVMDILLSTLDFAASYNSLANLRARMRHVPTDRPPMNLLRQELTGTCIYLDLLRRATGGDAGNAESASAAEERLVSFCTHVLVEVSPAALERRRSPAGTGGRSNLEIHQLLQLRSPVVVAVLRGMCLMNPLIFKKHLREFYPSITKLICCEQMDIRRALGDLFSMQLSVLLPQSA